MASRDAQDRIYVAGGCSVCAGAGAAVFLKSLDGGAIFFGCPSCGCAWPTPPDPHVVDSIEPPERFAPAGFTYAQISEIKTAGLEPLIESDEEAKDWDFRGARGFSPVVA